MAELKDAAQTWQDFLETFGLPAYDENTVPDDADMPRITYSWADASFEEPVTMTINIWYRSKSWRSITMMADTIYKALARPGVTLPFDEGYIWVRRGAPFSQRVADSDDGIRRILINTTVEFFRN